MRMPRLLKWIALAAASSCAALAAGCTSIAFMIANSATLNGTYERSTDHAYGPESRQKLDIYLPKG
jgi:hypothetical protein